MSARPCPTILGDCITVDSPIIGLSSQAEDVRYFYAPCLPGENIYAPPPLGGGIFVPKCDYLLLAGRTQAEADALAAEACRPPTPPAPPRVIYHNNQQTAQVPCLAPDYLTDDQGDHITDDQGSPIVIDYFDQGWTSTATVPYGAVTSYISQADADAQALAYATQIANSMAAAHNCDQNQHALVGAGGDQVIGAGGDPVEPVSW